jgi:hypothetical protein
MLEWMIVIYEMNTHRLVIEQPLHFPTREACDRAREGYNGWPSRTYALCRPIQTPKVGASPDLDPAPARPLFL